MTELALRYFVLFPLFALVAASLSVRGLRSDGPTKPYEDAGMALLGIVMGFCAAQIWPITLVAAVVWGLLYGGFALLRRRNKGSDLRL